jgi:hypothetical protein
MKEQIQKKLAIPLLALAIVGVGGTAYTLNQARPQPVHAQTPSTQPVTPTAQETVGDKQEPRFTSSIKAPAESATELNDVQEAQQLASLAKISEAQAKAAAEKSAGGTASSVKLEEENGSVVYAVTVGSQEIKVDAGNGAILHTEAADSGEKSGQPETPGQ